MCWDCILIFFYLSNLLIYLFSVIDLFDAREYSTLRKTNAYSNVRTLTGWTVKNNANSNVRTLTGWTVKNYANSNVRTMTGWIIKTNAYSNVRALKSWIIKINANSKTSESWQVELSKPKPNQPTATSERWRLNSQKCYDRSNFYKH